MPQKMLSIKCSLFISHFDSCHLTLNPFTVAGKYTCATPFFEKKGDFEIHVNAKELCLCVWMGKWLDYGGNIFFFHFA
jgi:hypothetical protein